MYTILSLSCICMTSVQYSNQVYNPGKALFIGAVIGVQVSY